MQQAKIVAFERQNNAVASESTTLAIMEAFDEEAKHMHDAKTITSGHSIQHNANRAKTVKVRILACVSPREVPR